MGVSNILLRHKGLLIKWIKFIGLISCPISKEMIGPCVFDPCEKHLSIRWVSHFLCHHQNHRLS
ncbi:hypothetical protein PAXRUDRAFT_165605 [Paxillus rubicundulus Ve08.2h10]|uniref:Uncharacterized protein n=1 Tax=Paxillus rubicundulus Ve08.2h10 TaxID=930991 RepID=A0A0D0C3V6_9AGAM|nr:hypothetical protein PAXRUDRAFT_165605 [Paxillus rubicundulus Ve08.2h10]